MKPAPFDYVAPTTIDEACSVLAAAGGGATVLAGGQTLVPLLNLRMSQPFIIVDLNKIAELKGIARANGCTRIGPMTRQCEVIASEALAHDLPVLVQAMRHRGGARRDDRGAFDTRRTPYPGARVLSRPLYDRAASRRGGDRHYFPGF